MKKNLLLTTLTLIISLLFIQCGRRNNTNSNSTEEDMTDVSSEEEYDLGEEVTVESLTLALNKAIDRGDYAKAYSFIAPYHTFPTSAEDKRVPLFLSSFQLNEIILKHEVADLVGTDNNGDNAGKILFAIQEKARYNKISDFDELREQKKMLENAIDLASASGNDVLAERLSKSLNQISEKK